MNWSRTDFEEYFDICQGATIPEEDADPSVEDVNWDNVKSCLGLVFCPADNQTPFANVNVNSDDVESYTNSFKTPCFAQADEVTSIGTSDASAWNQAVTTCMENLCGAAA